MNDYVLEILLREKKREMLAEAKRQRLLKMYDKHHSGRQVRFLALIGKHLVKLGERLIERFGSNEELSSYCDKQQNYSH